MSNAAPAAGTSPLILEPASPARPMSTNRFEPRWDNHINALFGGRAQRRLARAGLMIDPVRHWEKEYSRLSDAELRQCGLRLRGRARGGENLDKVLPEAFGLVCVASQRTI